MQEVQWEDIGASDWVVSSTMFSGEVNGSSQALGFEFSGDALNFQGDISQPPSNSASSDQLQASFEDQDTPNASFYLLEDSLPLLESFQGGFEQDIDFLGAKKSVEHHGALLYEPPT